MNTIIIYYSRTGNTQFVAQEIALNLGAEIKPLVDKKDRSGVLGWLKAGFDATRKKTTEIEGGNLDLDKYDLIFLGCPNWASQIPPALRTFLTNVNLDNKKVVLFCTQDGLGAEKVFNNLRLLAKGADVIGQKAFNKPNKYQEQTRQDIKDWLEQLLANKQIN